eukprot:gnl/TRDRNA2_/TRDRNA2_76755_c2_seq1.p1 gnl/TRDRNA2_/TRDRNA2_76755_c2~~gnl/TRDRNA2_/TRDRNA2_76755_c2_seq1.p1  ORF type:complete len:264 (+),score=18.65 gnl/TRDRNA2_/TRDRNA2_76755_c2_seq1:89-880(+)
MYSKVLKFIADIDKLHGDLHDELRSTERFDNRMWPFNHVHWQDQVISTDREDSGAIDRSKAMAMTSVLHAVIDNMVVVGTTLQDRYNMGGRHGGLFQHGSLLEIDEAMQMFATALEPLKNMIKNDDSEDDDDGNKKDMRIWKLISLLSELRLATQNRCSDRRAMNSTSRVCESIWSRDFGRRPDLPFWTKLIFGKEFNNRTVWTHFDNRWQFVLLELTQVFSQYEFIARVWATTIFSIKSAKIAMQRSHSYIGIQASSISLLL